MLPQSQLMEKNEINPSNLHCISMNILLITVCSSLLLLMLQSIMHSIYPSWNELIKIPLFIPETNTTSCFPNDNTQAWKTLSSRITIHLLKKWLLAWRHSFKFNKFQPDSTARHSKMAANLFTKLPRSTMHSLYAGDEPLSFLTWLWSGLCFLTTSQVRTLAFFGSNEFHTKLSCWKEILGLMIRWWVEATEKIWLPTTPHLQSCVPMMHPWLVNLSCHLSLI